MYKYFQTKEQTTVMFTAFCMAGQTEIWRILHLQSMPDARDTVTLTKAFLTRAKNVFGDRLYPA